MGGPQGKCVYIDTEGSFVPERVREMAQALVERLGDMAKTMESSSEITLPTADTIMDNIFYYRVHDYIEQLALIHQLPNILKEDPMIKLVVVDSVAFHFRHDFGENMSLRTRLLNGTAQSLLQLAMNHQAAVVLINQVTTKVNEFKPSMLVPALGESWGHTVPYRVMLYWEAGTRYAHLYKSPAQEAATVPFQLTQEGVRDI
jgi:RAD51-like protein 2